MKKLDMQDFQEKYKTYFILYKYLYLKISIKSVIEYIEKTFHYFSLLNKERRSGSVKEAVYTNVQNKSIFVLLFKVYKHINIWEFSSTKIELQLLNLKNQTLSIKV